MQVKKCIKETGNVGILFPDIAKEYCECSHDLLSKEFSKSEYLELLNKPKEEQLEISKPIFQVCLTAYQDNLKSQESDEWTEAEYALMVDKCIQHSGVSAINYPTITREYCECSRTQMIEHISKAEMSQLMQQTEEERNERLNPLITDCQIEFEETLKEAVEGI